VLIVVLSVLNGFERELRSRMLAVTSHATITGVDGYIANWREAQADAAREPDVVAVVPSWNRVACSRMASAWPVSWCAAFCPKRK
jgi:ABC-type lipoprotein release transport system permease subunit